MGHAPRGRAASSEILRFSTTGLTLVAPHAASVTATSPHFMDPYRSAIDQHEVGLPGLVIAWPIHFISLDSAGSCFVANTCVQSAGGHRIAFVHTKPINPTTIGSVLAPSYISRAFATSVLSLPYSVSAGIRTQNRPFAGISGLS